MENAGTRFNTHTLSKEFIEEQFKKYRQRHPDEDEKIQRENFQKLLDGIFKRQPAINGAKVFCVGCGAQKRTLHKWHNSYLCNECYKIMKNAGEEKFIKALKGEES